MGQVLVIEEGLAVRCGDCGLNMWWQGKKPRIRACGCTPVAAPKPQHGSVTLKARESTKKKGNRGEKAAASLMTGAGLLAMQTSGSGATASRSGDRHFDSDVIANLGDLQFRIESKLKDRITGLHSLSKLLDRSDVLRVQETNKAAFWLVPEAKMAELVGLAAEAAGERS